MGWVVWISGKGVWFCWGYLGLDGLMVVGAGMESWFVDGFGCRIWFWVVVEAFILQSVSKKTTHLGLENTQQK